MIAVGLAGGIGSGKSTVAGFLEKLGARCLDLDKTGHEVLREDAGVRAGLVREFGDAILDADGHISRAKLGTVVFNDTEALSRLNAIVHLAIDQRLQAALETARKDKVAVICLEAGAMLESGRSWQVDEIWVTVAPESVIIKRVMERSGITAAAVMSVIRSQMTSQEREKLADVLIDTDCTLDDLERRIQQEWESLQDRINRRRG